MQNSVKNMVLVLIALFANSVLATEARTPVNERHHCESITEANYCKAIAGCSWDDVSDICQHVSSGEVSVRHGCWRYERRWSCENAGCNWRHGRCESGGGGGGGGGYGCRDLGRHECYRSDRCYWSDGRCHRRW